MGREFPLVDQAHFPSPRLGRHPPPRFQIRIGRSVLRPLLKLKIVIKPNAIYFHELTFRFLRGCT